MTHTLSRIIIGICAVALIAVFFQPWVRGPGGGISAPRLRENLEGTHHFLSVFKKKNRVSHNYAIAPWLWAIPGTAGVTLVAAAIPIFPLWPGFLAGGAAIGASRYLQAEVERIPFHRAAEGPGRTERLGYVLSVFTAMGMVTRRRTRRSRRR